MWNVSSDVEKKKMFESFTYKIELEHKFWSKNDRSLQFWVPVCTGMEIFSNNEKLLLLIEAKHDQKILVIFINYCKLYIRRHFSGQIRNFVWLSNKCVRITLYWL